jgi:hypothetical protein
MLSPAGESRVSIRELTAAAFADSMLRADRESGQN